MTEGKVANILSVSEAFPGQVDPTARNRNLCQWAFAEVQSKGGYPRWRRSARYAPETRSASLRQGFAPLVCRWYQLRCHLTQGDLPKSLQGIGGLGEEFVKFDVVRLGILVGLSHLGKPRQNYRGHGENKMIVFSAFVRG